MKLYGGGYVSITPGGSSRLVAVPQLPKPIYGICLSPRVWGSSSSSVAKRQLDKYDTVATGRTVPTGCGSFPPHHPATPEHNLDSISSGRRANANANALESFLPDCVFLLSAHPLRPLGYTIFVSPSWISNLRKLEPRLKARSYIDLVRWKKRETGKKKETLVAVTPVTFRVSIAS